MGDSNDEISLTDVVVAQPAAIDQNELIMQLMQQITEMRVEMQRMQDLHNPVFAFNTPGDGRPPLYFPPSNAEQAQNPPHNPAQNPSTIDPTTPNPHQASVSYQTPPPPQVTQNTQSPSIAPPLPQKTTFQIPIPNEPYANCSELDHYEEQERKWRSKEEAAKLNMKEEIRKAMNELHCVPEVDGLSYEDLCIHSNLDLPKGFKVPKFDTSGGTGNPLAHLRAYCDQLVGVGKNEALLMRLFGRSLNGEALEWFTSHEIKQWSSWNALAKNFVERFAYNVEIVPDRYSLERIKRKSPESYREYAYRWRKEAARVRPPMSEKEIIEVSIHIQEPEYYDRIMLLIGAKFVEIVKVVEAIEDGIKTGKISRVAALIESSRLLKKKREDMSYISYASDGKGHFRKSSPYKGHPRAPKNSYPACYTQSAPSPHYQNTHPYYQAPSVNYSNIQSRYQIPPPYYQNTPPSYRAPQYPNFQTQVPTHQNPPNYCQVPSHPGNNYNPPREKKPSRVFTPLVESRTQLFERLKSAGLIQTIDLKNINVNSKLYRPDLHCAYHSGGAGHITEDCINLKHKIQDLIDQKVATLQTATPSVNSNPMPNHGGVTINMVKVEEDLNVNKVIISANLEKLEKVVASPT
ncbi:uncharacterized protein [Solanum tuberosum]|uniref:uncharacterized protein n=1 Tax=Solanum tuberosum TaxID=4113 RepID=UPI000739F95F|nr:PREDICTED: uncharacterized protein LOC107063358 [Solanum tuberosum]